MFLPGDDMEGVERGCGVREPGGIYAECGLSTDGSGEPLWRFLFDPPRPLGELMVSPRGVTLVERPDGSGIVDIYDWVGESGYPNVADMVEEIGRFGLSRRLSKGLDFSQLQPGALIFLVHPKAIVLNTEELYDALAEEAGSGTAHPYTCPCFKAQHNTLPAVNSRGVRPMCAGLWWELVAKGDASYDPGDYQRTVTRQSGSTRYQARQAPHGFKPQYAPGIFARFPIHRLVIVNDEEGERHELAHERADASGLPVVDVDF